MRDELRKHFPHGHPLFVDKTLSDVSLHSIKNRDYARDGDALGNFKRVARILSLYPNFPWASPRGVALTYLLKQLDAVMWNAHRDGNDMAEGRERREQDIAIYTNIIRCMEDNGV